MIFRIVSYGRVQVVVNIIFRYTILGGSHVRFPKIGRARNCATHAVAVPLSILVKIWTLTDRPSYPNF